MKKTGFYYLLSGMTALCILGFVLVGNARSQSDSADPNRPASDAAPAPDPEKDPNAPAPAEESSPIDEDYSDPILEENDSRIYEFFNACDQLFSTYVTEKGMVQYAALRRSRLELLPLMRLLKEISPLHLMALEQEAKTAFWINVYNVCVLQLIVDNYPIQPKWYMIRYPNDSIMQLSNPWTKHYFWVQGLQYNLQEIEQEFLLHRTRDPRICFVLSYASLGGGRQRPEAYRPAALDRQLDQQVLAYLNSPFGCVIDRDNKTIHLSVIFQTRRNTFLQSDYAKIRKFRQYSDLQRTWLNFLDRYLTREEMEFIENNTCSFKMINFDWHLDETF